MSYKLGGVIWNDDGTMATKTNIDQIEPSGNDLINNKLRLQELELLDTASAYNGEQHKAICGRAALELIEYKKIEKELGIDLITLFKLINAKNVYSYGHTNIMKNTGQVDIYDRTITIWNGSCHQTYPLSEYGKSFALTREELL